MINKKLLEKELQYYKERNQELQPVKFSRKLIEDLFEEFSYYGMVINSYCCRGEEHCCWSEPYEEGIFDYKLDDIREYILGNIDYAKKYLYNQRKYGKRFYMYIDNDICSIYIYTRDKLEADYLIQFSKNII